MKDSSTDYQADDRANRLHAYELEQSSTAWFLNLRGSEETTRHIVGALPRARAVRPAAGDRQWPQRVRLDFEPPSNLAELLDLLTDVYVIEIQHRASLDAALALDFYRESADGTGSQLTETGEWVRRVKRYDEHRDLPQQEVDEAGQKLCTALVDAILQHEWFLSAGKVLLVPGHEPGPSASVLLGAGVAEQLGRPRVGVEPVAAKRKPAKQMTTAERAGLLGGYRVKEDLAGETVLIVDDLYQTGSTMAGVARAARAAGATTVLGIAATRTLSTTTTTDRKLRETRRRG
ncbi:phosphoribosyltransferase [Amycolatopsis sp. NBC_01480]|uniref:phosphoribosyltransferase n=1 Tax=Amycolatopsis sp. NBC_01480 TaxID=2903562 RepID=UPI002E2DDBD9|nr:phosphoribosyltransferase [Amycolatopsis sp. NBC_01480]